MSWWKNLKGKVKFNEPLKEHTTFRIGGPAKFFIEPSDYCDLKVLLKAAKSRKLNLLVIGAGSNILAHDKGVEAAVLHFSRPGFKKVSLRGNRLRAGCAVRLSKLVALSKEKGITGLEFLAGIPGTVAGALVGNAGISVMRNLRRAKSKSISDSLENVTVMDYNGKTKTLLKKNIKFGYRSSDLDKYVVLEAEFKVARAGKKKIRDRISRLLKKRRASQDYEQFSAGCVFKNPEGYSAGKLIDECGLKGKKIGNMVVSLKHANFILNRGGGKFSDALELMGLIKDRVRHKFGIKLEPEIKIWR